MSTHLLETFSNDSFVYWPLRKWLWSPDIKRTMFPLLFPSPRSEYGDSYYGGAEVGVPQQLGSYIKITIQTLLTMDDCYT